MEKSNTAAAFVGMRFPAAVRRLLELGLGKPAEPAAPAKRTRSVKISGRVPLELAAGLEAFEARHGIDRGEALARCIRVVMFFYSELDSGNVQI